MSDAPREAERVRTMREVLTATGAGIYLATHVAGPWPAETLAAVHAADDMELRIGRVGPDRADDLEQRELEARAVVAAVVAASPDRVVLCHGAVEAAAAVAFDLIARRGGEQAGPARVVVVEGTPEPLAAAIASVAGAMGAQVERLEAVPRIVSAETALVVMAHVDADGRLADVAVASAAAHHAGARLLVDASLSVGAVPIEVDGLGADVVIAEVHRWLLGPEGMAVVWLAPSLDAEAPGRLRARSGTFARGSLLALARSVGWLLMYVELPWLLARTARLAERLHAGLEAIDGVQLLTPAGEHGALISFRITGWDAEQVADELSRSVFAILEADPEHDRLRASVGGWTLETELDRFLERVAELASHTPESLPRRPTLTVLAGNGGGSGEDGGSGSGEGGSGTGGKGGSGEGEGSP